MQGIFLLALASAAATALLTGASLDQSIKQLPARNRIGTSAYAAYTRAADLGNGVAFYSILGVSAVVLSVTAAVVAWRADLPANARLWLILSGNLAILHTLTTIKAAPTMFSQKQFAVEDTRNLARVFDRFTFWQTLRVSLQVLNTVAAFLALAALAGP